ncbi:MAG: HD-GYP domain-containing protein [Candidatus Aminicenantes bacterium]|nr:HD-GYP domain-containing protein [Candidatus Aminicenantes bacterium]
MVRLSELIKKSKEGRLQEKEKILTKANQLKENSESYQGIQKAYELAVFRIKHIMMEIKRGKTVDGKEIVSLADNIVENLQIRHQTFLSLIHNFTQYSDGNDYLFSHSINVAVLAVNLGISMDYKKEELVDLCISALVHDIGMLNVPQEIIAKPGKLTREEFERIREHPADGLKLLENINSLPKTVSEVIYQHHEKINGRGYPDGKSMNEISKSAQIVGIAEIYEAMTHHRPYRIKSFIPFEAVKNIVKEEKDSFSPELLKVFLNYITFYPMGSYVRLNSGEIGKVVSVNPDAPLRPVIEIIRNPEGRFSEIPIHIDLEKSPVLYIEKALDENEF